ncbi:MAG: hypothetical protein RLZZ297_1013 [Chloroflexota bacterium]|jgi:hypothetical protein
MYEHRRHRVISTQAFVQRMLRHITVAGISIVIAWGIGALGYRTFEQLPWIDALLNAAMILGGMGPVATLQTTAGKLFASLYALFAGIFFIGITGIVLAPVLHRVLHRLHVDE